MYKTPSPDNLLSDRKMAFFRALFSGTVHRSASSTSVLFTLAINAIFLEGIFVESLVDFNIIL